MTDKQVIIDGEHDMNYCKDNNCKHYGNKEQCKKNTLLLPLLFQTIYCT